MRLYLAGPMRGKPQFNFPAFDAAAARLRAQGHTVFSPAERDRQDGFNPSPETTGHEEVHDMSYYMAIDLPEVCKAQGIALLPGWEDSEGSRIEVTVGVALRKQIFDADTMIPLWDPNGFADANPIPTHPGVPV